MDELTEGPGSNNRLVIYTALFGDYDNLVDPPEEYRGCDFVCFTDQRQLKSKVWEIRIIEHCDLPPNLMNRRYKMLPHLFFSDYTYSLYIDSNVGFKVNPILKISDLNKNHIMVYEHQFRKSIAEEAKECARLGYHNLFKFCTQLKRYFIAGFDVNRSGLYECNIIYRRHNDIQVESAMEDWWREYVNGVKRDQISFPYILWKHSLKPRSMGVTNIRNTKTSFELHEGHKKGRSFAQKIIGRMNRILLGLYERG
ncbi:hypothetical protein C9993_03465 [Marinobacter sp. Z-F4-2]|nr:hypothetical protein C9993_03465 [Marinobacter sp. Z-F4-2]